MSPPEPGPPESPSPMIYTCPGCGEQVSIDAGTLEPTAICPYCSIQFAVDSGLAIDAEDYQRARRALEANHQAELDSLRIRQISAMKRAAYRTRSYAILAAFTCAVAIGQLIFMAVQQIRWSGWNVWAIAYFLLTPLCLWVALHFIRKAAALHREARQTILPEPASPPDFSALSDGSDRWKNLENIR